MAEGSSSGRGAILCGQDWGIIMNVNGFSAKLAVTLAGIIAATSAIAGVTGGTITGGTLAGGQVLVIDAPATVADAGLTGNDVRVWNEVQNFKLSAPLTIDLGGTTLAAGTWVSSHSLLFRPLFNPRRQETIGGTVSFDSTILGVIQLTQSLADSDFLGAPGTTYLTPDFRGVELGARDVTSFTGSTLTYFLMAQTSPGDNVRVLTLGSPQPDLPGGGDIGVPGVPEPAVWLSLIAGFAMVGAAARRRGFHTARA